MSDFKVDLIAACQSYVPHTPVPENELDHGDYLVALDDAITALLKNDYPNMQLNPVIMPGEKHATIRVIGDENWNAKDDTFEVVYKIAGTTANFSGSGAVT